MQVRYVQQIVLGEAQVNRANGATRWPSHGMHHMQETIYDRISPEETPIWTSREGQLSMHNLQSRVLHRNMNGVYTVSKS